MEINFTELQITVQQVIDLIAAKDLKAANNKLADASELLDELLDHARRRRTTDRSKQIPGSVKPIASEN